MEFTYNVDAIDGKDLRMKTVAKIALGAFIVCALVSLAVHRRVVVAAIKGEPLPEPPEWHRGHACLSKE